MSEIQKRINQMTVVINELEVKLRKSEDELVSYLITTSDGIFEIWLEKFMDQNYHHINEYITKNPGEGKAIKRLVHEQKDSLSSKIKEKLDRKFWAEFERDSDSIPVKLYDHNNPVLNKYKDVFIQIGELFHKKGITIIHGRVEIFDPILVEVSKKVTELKNELQVIDQKKQKLKSDSQDLEKENFKKSWRDL